MTGAVPNWAGADVDRRRLSMSVSRMVAYDVEHTRAPVFEASNNALALAADGLPVFIVVDETLWPMYGSQLESYAQAHLDCLGIVRVAGTEATKSIEGVAALCAAAFDKSLPRQGVFIAVGGGTILDAVGFAASIYRRGVAYLRIPTTLIGMIDVGVGIKQGVNFRNKKNALGSFYPPRHTINDVSFLWHLPWRELACGIAEALKMGLVCDGPLFELIEQHAAALLLTGFRSPGPAGTEILMRSEVAMMDQLSTNLYESELRRLVDFGHSFSPIIETASDYAVKHGEAVALDMLLSTAIAAGRGICDAALIRRLRRIYAQIGLPWSHPSMSPLLMERALVDARAHRGGALNLVVPTKVGSADFLQDVTYDEIAFGLRSIAAAR